jgi:hypothetical protein
MHLQRDARMMLLSALLVATSCLRQPSAPIYRVAIPEPPPEGVSGAAWRALEDSVPRIRARVLALDVSRGIGDAMFEVADSAGRRLARGLTPANGTFEAGVPGAGTYVVRVRRIGYDGAAATIRIRQHQSASVVVLLAEQAFDLSDNSRPR